MLPPKKTISPKQKELTVLFSQLNDADRESLLAFAQFLFERSSASAKPDAVTSLQTTKPLDIPRPTKESVVAAIRRLSQTYPMLNKDELFHESSSLMTAHIMKGRAAEDVIDELEMLFSKSYEKHSSVGSE